MKKSGMPTTHEARCTYTEVTPFSRLAYDNWVDFVPGAEPYATATIVELFPTAQGVKMVLTLDAMHNEEWTNLWFDNNAEEAVNFYAAVFKNSKILNVARYGESGPGPKGSVMTMTFQLEGQRFMALNGGPHFKFTEAISLMVDCESQQEVDELWTKLTAGGGSEGQCGWCKDKFGLSWQIVPSAFFRLASDKDPEKSKRVVAAMLQKKLDIARLEQAYNNG